MNKDALEFDYRKELTNYQLAVAMRIEGQPRCPRCGEPWPFIWNGCDWCGLPERPGDRVHGRAERTEGHAAGITAQQRLHLCRGLPSG